MSDRYNAQEFDTVAYMSTSGGLGCADSDARGNYYNVGGIPHVVFGGTTNIVGAGTDAINGSVYDPIVQSMLDDPTPVKLTITDYDFGATPYVTFAVELEGDLADISQTELRVAILEDGVGYESELYDNVLRDVLPDVPLTISQAGQIQQETVNFGIDEGWIADNLRLIVFVQDDANRHIHQMATTRPEPDYTFRYCALGERTVVDAGAGPGTLARSILAAGPTCSNALDYIAVEVSAPQRERHPDGITSQATMPTGACAKNC